MKSLKHYLVESIHTYDYTIYVAGETAPRLMDLLKYNLNKFDPVSVSDPTTTPIQKKPYGFPELENESVHVIKCEFRYPANEPMIRQMFQLLGGDMNKIRVVGTKYAEGCDEELEGYENQAKISPLLTHEEMEEQPGAKEAAKAYGEQYLSDIHKQYEKTKIDIPYAAEKTKSAFDPFKKVKEEDVDSPMSKMTRPEKPKTGAMK